MAELHGFELVREQEIAEIRTLAKYFRHKRTGAELLSLENDDENKVFGITFRTPAQDSTGIAHIMEHSVLCGSRKYPVKEPFVELIKGSLNTFLNAFTYPDKTCYPVASQNLQDFYNLIDVYLDAVFYPDLTPFTLQQEGWHYELERRDGELSYKGVVYNEMKGNYSSPDRLLAEYSQQAVFPDTTYRHESGGHPHAIPDLTWEAFKAFHTTYYHPSNSRIYFYGDDPAEKRLELLDAYLKDFDSLDIPSRVEKQPPIPKVRLLEKRYPASENPEKQKAMLTVNWLLPEAGDPTQTLSLAVLDHILMGTQASPLRKALIDSGLGEDVTGAGLETELRQMYISYGMKGIATDRTKDVEQLILQTLQELVREGIAREMVEASLNTIEFRLRENNTGSYPRGLVLMLRCLARWLYDLGPIEAIGYEKPLQDIKKALAQNPAYFENLIEQHILQNPHRATVLLLPDPNLASEEEQRERARLEAFRRSATEETLQKIIDSTKMLKARQATPDPPEALAKIPALKLEDVDRQHKPIPCEIFDDNGARILYHDLFTNGIVYFSVGFDYHAVPRELLPYLPLFSRALRSIGTTEEDFVTLSQRIGRKTGGISPSLYSASKFLSQQATTLLLLRGKAMMHQTDDLLAIMQDMITKLKLDNRDRFLQLLLEDKAGLEAAIVPNGTAFVHTRLKAGYHEAGWLSEQLNGVDSLFFLRRLAEEVKNNWPAVLEKLERIRTLVFSRNGLICNVTLDLQNWRKFQPRLHGFLGALPERKTSAVAWKIDTAPAHEGLTIPAQVNYVGKAANLYDLGYTFHGSALVIQKFLRTTWLWDRVRVQGGAYGGFCTFDRRTGVFAFLSYRDPNLLETIDNFDRTSEFLKSVELSKEEISKAIIGTIGDIDAYQLPDAKGATSLARYLANETDADLQQLRDEVLATTAQDFRDFASYLEQARKRSRVVVLGARDAIAAANLARKNWLTVVSVL